MKKLILIVILLMATANAGIYPVKIVMKASNVFLVSNDKVKFYAVTEGCNTWADMGVTYNGFIQNDEDDFRPNDVYGVYLMLHDSVCDIDKIQPIE